MRKLVYLSLESYTSRYTYQLTDWNKRVFDRRNLNVTYISGPTLDHEQKIVIGQVLDAHGRSYFAMGQMMNLVKMMQQGQINSDDVIYFEDMFTPGFEILGYIINQIPAEMRPRIFVRCLAQTIDPDDFVHVCGMQKWMGHYEKMVDEIVKLSNGAILASNEEMVANMKIAGWEAPIYNISGLAFGKQEVLERVNNTIIPFNERKLRVAFAARFDQEKNPGFFMDVIDTFYESGVKNIEFCILSGSNLRSNNQQYVDRARQMQYEGKLVIHENLTKNLYYELLNDTRVGFNCASQDWTSNTVSEADTLGCNVLFPAYRSFPEIFANDHERMYIPWSLTDAVVKLDNLLHNKHQNIGKISDWTDKTVDRIIDILEGNGEQWLRMSSDYRKHIVERKY